MDSGGVLGITYKNILDTPFLASFFSLFCFARPSSKHIITGCRGMIVPGASKCVVIIYVCRIAEINAMTAFDAAAKTAECLGKEIFFWSLSETLVLSGACSGLRQRWW